MSEKYNTVTMEDGQEFAEHSPEMLSEIATQNLKFSFIKDLHEARMTKDNGSSRKLTFSDCCERLYLTLLILETMRKYPDFKNTVQKYAKKTVGFETYRYYRIMGTDLYNFIYFKIIIS